ncbi:glycoside hydrolase family 172 protein [Allokutzneria oryzae]|uniref:Glycoside hydrolase family 172 protein n=1 Tax=Allokutzneria oryzae TaxID=1378989 RepID=A0ABV6ACB3_9PSEU
MRRHVNHLDPTRPRHRRRAQHRTLRLLTTLASVGALTLGAVAAQPVPSHAQEPAVTGLPSGKGPLGWATYRQLDSIGALRGATDTRQFSSYDRTGGNNDGFDGFSSCLRMVGPNCVIAERAGAGEISSIWFTRDDGIVTKTGWIRIELDGTTVLEAPLQDVVDGKLGAPFVWPLVGNREDTSGGAVIKVPMPYRQSMRITTQNNPLFYHVAYRSFADADGVTTFNRADQANDVIAKLRSFGLSDPKPARRGATTNRSTVEVNPGATTRAAELTGPGVITQLKLRLPQVQAGPSVSDDGRAFGAGGSSTFQVAVDPRNEGVRLTKRLDPFIEEQRARVLVDGAHVGDWYHGPKAPAGEWADQSIDIGPQFTSGKSKLTIRNEFVSSSVDYNEFRYDVHSLVGGTWIRTDVMDIGPERPHEELAHGYRIEQQKWQGRRYSVYPTDPNAVTASDAVLDGARLRITFDGRTTVDAPIGEFFGSGLGEYDVRSLMFSMDATRDGWYTSWWPMPFAERAVVEIVNGSGVRIPDATVDVTWAADRSVTDRLRPNGSLGYFNATHRRGPTEHTKDWIFVDTPGRGVFYGVTHSMRGRTPLNAEIPRFYLEGDERVYADGLLTPVQYGTGTEDFYESGWYFRTGTYGMPLAGYPAHEEGKAGCRFDCTGAYRLMLPDAVTFHTGLRFGIEHGPLADIAADYSSTAYWYGQPRWALRSTDGVNPTDNASRDQHNYRSTGESVADLTSVFEGDDDYATARGKVTATTGPVSFTVAVDQNNSGVQIVRTADQVQSYQQVRVLVDGQYVGNWFMTSGNVHQRWLQDSFLVPAKNTAGKRSLAITLEPVPGAPPWSASDYHIRSWVDPYDNGRSVPTKIDPPALDWTVPDLGPKVLGPRDPVSTKEGQVGR